MTNFSRGFKLCNKRRHLIRISTLCARTLIVTCIFYRSQQSAICAVKTSRHTWLVRTHVFCVSNLTNILYYYLSKCRLITNEPHGLRNISITVIVYKQDLIEPKFMFDDNMWSIKTYLQDKVDLVKAQVVLFVNYYWICFKQSAFQDIFFYVQYLVFSFSEKWCNVWRQMRDRLRRRRQMRVEWGAVTLPVKNLSLRLP